MNLKQKDVQHIGIRIFGNPRRIARQNVFQRWNCRFKSEWNVKSVPGTKLNYEFIFQNQLKMCQNCPHKVDFVFEFIVSFFHVILFLSGCKYGSLKTLLYKYISRNTHGGCMVSSSTI